MNNAPFRLQSVETPVRGLAPTLGQHTTETLMTVLGLSNADVQKLFTDRIVA